MFHSPANSSYDAVVVGGGPAGGTAAILLSRAGWRVAIVERSSFPRRKVCGEFMSATSLPLLFELGIDRAFLDCAGPPVHRIGLYAGDTVLDAAMPRSSGPVEGWGRALGREHLDLLLLDGARRAGAQTWQPWRAASVTRSGSRWVCGIEREGGRRELTAPVMIVAAGSWEGGPFALRGKGSHHASDLLAFKAHFRDFDLADDLMPLLAFPGGYGGLVNTDDGRVSLSCCIRRDGLHQCRRAAGHARAGEAVVLHIQRSCEGVRRAIGRAKLEGAWLAAGPIRPGVRNQYLHGVFMSGNIAGEAHPIVAEGISMAMQSSWLMCRRLIAEEHALVAGRDPAPTGKAYEADWHAAFALRIHAAALFAYLAISPRAAALCRPLLQNAPQLLTLGAKFSGKTRYLTLNRC
jgi:flavin-dependent dehydrogenase